MWNDGELYEFLHEGRKGSKGKGLDLGLCDLCDLGVNYCMDGDRISGLRVGYVE